MNTILKLSLLSILLLSAAGHSAHASACADGVPEGTLEAQINFLLACEPASGPSTQAAQARQDGNGAAQSSSQSEGANSATGGSHTVGGTTTGAGASTSSGSGGKDGHGSGNSGVSGGPGASGGSGAGSGSGSGSGGNGGPVSPAAAQSTGVAPKVVTGITVSGMSVATARPTAKTTIGASRLPPFSATDNPRRITEGTQSGLHSVPVDPFSDQIVEPGNRRHRERKFSQACVDDLENIRSAPATEDRRERMTAPNLPQSN
jgi:hypothetical protein